MTRGLLRPSLRSPPPTRTPQPTSTYFLLHPCSIILHTQLTGILRPCRTGLQHACAQGHRLLRELPTELQAAAVTRVGYGRVAHPTDVTGLFLLDLDNQGDRAQLRRIAVARASSAAGLRQGEFAGERCVFSENAVLVQGSAAVLAVSEQWQAVDGRGEARGDVAVKFAEKVERQARRERRREKESRVKSRVLQERQSACVDSFDTQLRDLPHHIASPASPISPAMEGVASLAPSPLGLSGGGGGGGTEAATGARVEGRLKGVHPSMPGVGAKGEGEGEGVDRRDTRSGVLGDQWGTERTAAEERARRETEGSCTFVPFE